MTDTLTIRELCSNEPILRDSRQLARDLAAIAPLVSELSNTDNPRTFSTTVDPTGAFVLWGRCWNWIACEVSGSGWRVTGQFRSRIHPTMDGGDK